MCCESKCVYTKRSRTKCPSTPQQIRGRPELIERATSSPFDPELMVEGGYFFLCSASRNVPRVGLEPTTSCEARHLKPLRKPIPPSGLLYAATPTFWRDFFLESFRTKYNFER